MHPLTLLPTRFCVLLFVHHLWFLGSHLRDTPHSWKMPAHQVDSLIVAFHCVRDIPWILVCSLHTIEWEWCSLSMIHSNISFHHLPHWRLWVEIQHSVNKTKQEFNHSITYRKDPIEWEWNWLSMIHSSISLLHLLSCWLWVEWFNTMLVKHNNNSCKCLRTGKI